MGKNIVICADGTGNTAIKGRGTNVFKLYEAVDQVGHRLKPGLTPQVAIYHDGVGTESLKWLRLLTGATGWGLSRNVKQLYGELSRVYAPGDKIFLFGFSRGAFTVRTLAGLIHACGILDLARYPTNEAFDRGVADAYAEYRRQYATWPSALWRRPLKLDDERVAQLRRRFSVRVPEFLDPRHGRLIEFMGVWDTVDAVGLPVRAADFVNAFIYSFKFPDRTLSASVAHACQALALDEERESFAPVLWNEAKTTDPERIEQVWFAGVHSNVGGGYPRQGMSLVALEWIMARAEPRGLRFVEAEREMYRYHADVGDKLYDSRRGLRICYRWLPRNVRRLCADNGVAPKVHGSVFERIARNTEGYAPGSLPPDAEVVSLAEPPAVTEAIRALVRAHHGASGPLVERATRLLGLGRWAYWTFVWGLIVTGLLGARLALTAVREGTGTWPEAALSLAQGLLSAAWIGPLAQTFARDPWLVAWLALTLALALWVDGRLDRRYSGFWHSDNMRLKLRNTLGLG